MPPSGRFARRTRALVVSSSPRVMRVRRGRSSAAWSCLRRAPSPGPSMERSGAASSAQSLETTSPEGSHAVTRAVCWLRPSWLSLSRPARGNGSVRHAGRSRRGGAPCGPRLRGRCCDHGARGDAAVVGFDLVPATVAADGLDGGPTHQATSLLGDRPSPHLGSDWRWRGVRPAHEHSRSGEAKRATSPISATNTAASTGPTPCMAWMAR